MRVTNLLNAEASKQYLKKVNIFSTANVSDKTEHKLDYIPITWGKEARVISSKTYEYTDIFRSFLINDTDFKIQNVPSWQFRAEITLMNN